MKNKSIQIIVLFVCAFIISVILAQTVFVQKFMRIEPENVITIEATAKKNRNSWGTDVRLVDVIINGTIIPYEDLEYDENEWVSRDGVLMAFNPQRTMKISYRAEKVNTLKIKFQKHEGSGIVKISSNGKQLGKLDLYSPRWENAEIEKAIGKVSIFFNKVFFLNVFLVILLLLGTWWLVILYLKKEGLLSRKNIYVFIPCIILGFSCIYSGKWEEGILIAGLLAVCGLVVAMGLILTLKKKQIVFFIYNLFIIAASSIISVCVVEYANSNVLNLSMRYWIGNATVYFAIILAIYILTNKICFSITVGMFVSFLYGVVNYYVVLFRGSPIVPIDILSVTTAGRVASNYHYVISVSIFISLMIAISWCMYINIYINNISKLKRKAAMGYVIPWAITVVCLFNLEFYNPMLDHWNFNANTKQYGITMSFLSNVRTMMVAEPKDYSYDNVKNLCQQYKTEIVKRENVNVIAIMNESFSDLSVVAENLESNIYMPYYNALEDNTIKGQVMVSVFGGRTSNSEYEFLTGNTMGFIPGTIPYQQFIWKDSFSLAQVLKKEGYSTTAIHPYAKNGYSRYRVYPYLGFDEFIDVTGFENPDLSRNAYITDKESYKKVIEIFEANRKEDIPVFIFNVTMQNHGGYETGFFGEDSISVTGHEREFPDVEEYLTVIKESDDAFKELIDYFNAIQDPTVIIMFGDHQPRVSDSFYENMSGKHMAEWNLDDTQRLYEVPFFIWANFDIEEKSGVFTSVNYLSAMLCRIAGIPTTPYQNFLLELSESIPAMNINGYMDTENNWHSYGEETEEMVLIKDYWNIQYNNMFAKKKCAEWFTLSED